MPAKLSRYRVTSLIYCTHTLQDLETMQPSSSHPHLSCSVGLPSDLHIPVIRLLLFTAVYLYVAVACLCLRGNSWNVAHIKYHLLTWVTSAAWAWFMPPPTFCHCLSFCVSMHIHTALFQWGMNFCNSPWILPTVHKYYQSLSNNTWIFHPSSSTNMHNNMNLVLLEP